MVFAAGDTGGQVGEQARPMITGMPGCRSADDVHLGVANAAQVRRSAARVGG
jgi:hypothetical protein